MISHQKEMFASVNHKIEFNKIWLEDGKLNNDHGLRETNHEQDRQLSWKINK